MPKEMIEGLSNEFNLTRLAGHIIGDNLEKSPIEIGSLIVRAFHSQGGQLRVKCPDCEWSQFQDGEAVGMTPCYHCNSTGYIFEPLI